MNREQFILNEEALAETIVALTASQDKAARGTARHIAFAGNVHAVLSSGYCFFEKSLGTVMVYFTGGLTSISE